MMKEELIGILEDIQYVHTSNSGTMDWTAMACDRAIKSIKALDNLADEIYEIKHNFDSENTDYKTGYLCALSVVEGLIAECMEKENL